jgi:hypothetical protein
MLKTLLRMLTVGLFIFLALEPLANRPQAFHANREQRPSSPQSKKTTVEVSFDGLMVFAKVGDHYEVGIVDRNDHKFSYTIGKHTVTAKSLAEYKKSQRDVVHLLTSAPWTLEVMSGSGSPKATKIWARSNKPCNREQDTVPNENIDHAFDFCWIMDLEGEFHGGHELHLNAGKLKPIILLRQGELYTKYKYDQLEREQSPNSTSWNPYGFVAETVALRLDLDEGEYLILRNGKGEEAFRLPAGNGDTNAGIFNSPSKDYQFTMRARAGHSHFLYYYDLFSNVSGNEKIDIRVKEDGFIPLNRFPQDRPKPRLDDAKRKDTFDNQSCGAIYLGLSDSPLK